MTNPQKLTPVSAPGDQAAKPGAKDCRPEIDTSEIIADFQWHFPVDCHLFSGFLPNKNNGCSATIYNACSFLRHLVCKLLPRQAARPLAGRPANKPGSHQEAGSQQAASRQPAGSQQAGRQAASRQPAVSQQAASRHAGSQQAGRQAGSRQPAGSQQAAGSQGVS